MPRKTAVLVDVDGVSQQRFNEAAARCRGKPGAVVAWLLWGASCFNEAAARCRGKPQAVHRVPRDRLAASMRPRPDAAENLVS